MSLWGQGEQVEAPYQRAMRQQEHALRRVRLDASAQLAARLAA